MLCFCYYWHVRNLLVMVLRLNKSLKLAESVVSIHPHQAAQAQHQLWPLSTVYTPLLECCRQYQRSPLSVAPNFHFERSSPQTAGDRNSSNYTMLNTFKSNTRRMWVFAACPDTLNLLSIMNSMLTNIQSKTWTYLPNSTLLITSQTHRLNHRHLLCQEQKHSPVLALRWTITLLTHGNWTLRVALRQTYKTIPTTLVHHMNSTNISCVGSWRWAWRCTITMCWRKKTPLCMYHASGMGMACRSSWQACQMIRL